MESSIKNKVIVITVVSSGLSEATAKYLAAKGGIVVLGADVKINWRALSLPSFPEEGLRSARLKTLPAKVQDS